MADDPISDINTALTDPATGLFTIAGGAAQPGALYADIQPFVTAIFGGASPLAPVGKQINGALTQAAGVVGQIGTAMNGIGGTSLADVTTVMTTLQSALSLAQSLAPAASNAVLTSGGALFQEIESQLTGLGGGATLAQAGAELTELSQLLTGLANMFPA